MKVLNDLKKRSLQWFRAEFVPWWIQYISVYIFAFWKAIQTRNLLWFTATNPWVPLGGLYPTSKRDILKQFPKQFIPQTVYFKVLTDDIIEETLKKEMRNNNLQFPVILKPDNGVQGLWVVVLHSQDEIQKKIIQKNFFSQQKNRSWWLLQEFIDDSLEIGVFYVRRPWEKKWLITWMVVKEFLQVKGDGITTLEMLIQNHTRANLYIDLLSEKFATDRASIIPIWNTVDLVEVWTHSKGSTFIDASDKTTPKSTKFFDKLSYQIDGFFYGRYDIRVSSREAFEQWEFKIIEVNMTYSEPTWMYDPSYSFWKAQKILLNHWGFMYDIAKENHANGVEYATISERKKWKKIFEQL